MEIGITNFVTQHYQIIFKGDNVDLNDLSKVDEFLLCDDALPGCNDVNALFINTFSRNTDAVLVEETASMYQIGRDDSVQSVWLETQSSILGWDIGTAKDSMGSLCQEVKDNDRITEITIRKLLDPNCECQKELKDELQKLTEKTMIFAAQMLEQEKEIVEQCLNSAMKRAQSMLDSLTETKKRFSRTFLIAGRAFLLHNPLVQDPRLPLDFLHTSLKKRNLVALNPKAEIASTIAPKKAELMQEIATRVLQQKDPLEQFVIHRVISRW